jgi:DNA-binding GntR family transcriptional regulator
LTCCSRRSARADSDWSLSNTINAGIKYTSRNLHSKGPPISVPNRDSRRTADAVYRHLLNEIVEGTLAPDAKVSPDAVAEQLDVSRTPVREAILRLESEGLVERIPYRGVAVSRIDDTIAAQVAAVRFYLEGLAVRLAVPHLSAATLREMERTLQELIALSEGPSFTQQAWNTLNDRFHGLIYSATECPPLIRPLENLAAQASRMRRHLAVPQHDVRHGTANVDHRAILDACAVHDAERAAHEAQLHVLRTYMRSSGLTTIEPDSPIALVLMLAGLDLTEVVETAIGSEHSATA